MLSAAQIVADALQIAKCPGFSAQGGRALNFALDDLAQHRNLKINLVTTTIVLSPNSVGPYTLEADYLRTFEMSYVAGGQPYFLSPCTLKQFDQDNIPLSGDNYPSEYATDLSPNATQAAGMMYVYPTTNQPITLTHRYMIRRALITTPEASPAVPWFPDQDYLVQATAMRMMRITDDSRYDKFGLICENMLRVHLLEEGDEQQIVHEVQLDPRRFRQGSSKPTKLSPF